MSSESLNIVFLGLSITSSWGNGHATTYRGLVRELDRLGHRVLFLERDVPWYADNRDLPNPPYGETRLYQDLEDLRRVHGEAVREADAVIVGSYVPDGVEVGRWVQQTARGVTAFYDIDTPVTLAKLARKDYEYLAPELIPGYQLYLSFTGGPTLEKLEQQYGAPMARALYCSFDPSLYFPEANNLRWDLGYLGTYSPDRQPRVDSLLLQPAKRLPDRHFIVAGPQYPEEIQWPVNVQRQDHVPPAAHRGFYNAQRFTLNVTRDDMRQAGYSPSVRLFEAAACAVPVISDTWPGLETLFRPGHEVLLASSAEEVVGYLKDLPEADRRRIGEAARERVLAEHTAAHRARQLADYLTEAAAKRTEDLKRYA